MAKHSTKSKRQREQQKLVDRAQRRAGVAEAIAAYEKLRPYVPAPPVASDRRVTYGTGGNPQ